MPEGHTNNEKGAQRQKHDTMNKRRQNLGDTRTQNGTEGGGMGVHGKKERDKEKMKARTGEGERVARKKKPKNVEEGGEGAHIHSRIHEQGGR